MKILNSVQREHLTLILAYNVRPWTIYETIVARISGRHLTMVNEWFSILPKMPLFYEFLGLTVDQLLDTPELNLEFIRKINAVQNGDMPQLKELLHSYPMVRRNWLESLSREGQLDKLVSFALDDDCEHLYKKCKKLYHGLNEVIEHFPAFEIPYFIQSRKSLPIAQFQQHAIEHKDKKYFGMVISDKAHYSFNQLLSGWGSSTLLSLIAKYEFYKVPDFTEGLINPILSIELMSEDLPVKCYPRGGQGYQEVMYFKQGNRHFHTVV